jgi:hypothetical protein
MYPSMRWLLPTGLLVLAVLAASSAQQKEDRAKPGPANERLAKLLQARLEAANTEVDARHKEFQAGRGTLDIFLEACLRRLVARQELARGPDDHAAALEEHLKLMRDVHRMNAARFRAERVAITDFKYTEYALLEAEIWLEQAKAK